MKTKFNLLLLILGSVFLTASYSVAEDEKIELVKTKVNLVSMVPFDTKVMYLDESSDPESKKLKQVPVAQSYLPNAVEYKGPVSTGVYKDKGGKELVARIQFDPKLTHVIALLLPSKDKQGLGKVVVVDASDDKFPAASRKIYNLTAKKLRGEWGVLPFERGGERNRRFELPAGKMRTILSPDSKAKVNSSQPAILEVQNQKRWSTFYSSRWFHAPQQRHLIFIFPEVNESGMSVRAVSGSVQ